MADNSNLPTATASVHPADETAPEGALRTLVHEADALIVLADTTGVLRYVNRAAAAVLPAGPLPLTTASLFDAESLETIRTVAFPNAIADGAWHGELVIDHKGELMYVTTRISVVEADDDASLAIVCRDKTSQINAEATLRAQATRDALTGLPNRALLVEHLERTLARATRGLGGLPAVMFLDLDGFKAVNDGLGHEAGDELLVEVGQRLLECVRNTDVVARFGGDEFVILLENVSDLEIATTIANRILERVEEPVALSSGIGNVGTSIGITLATSADIEVEALLGEADTAMYRAKQLGKRRHQVYDAELRARAAARQQLRDQIAEAIESQAFATVYTPVCSVVSGEVTAVESGLRWMHRSRGVLGPSEFMALAREVGVARDLDHLVIEAAVAQARAWSAGCDEPRTVWVTVGVQDILSGELVRAMAERIEAGGIGPGSLGVEIPLLTLTKHPAEAQRSLQALNFNGVRIAIDDFGFDQFAPSQLQRYYADTVKLDRRMMTSLAQEPEAVGALAAVLSICNSLGLKSVAKGVDKLAELELLQELGCTSVQGKVVSRPLPAARITGLLEAAPPWVAEGAWPTLPRLASTLTRSQIAERMMKLRTAA